MSASPPEPEAGALPGPSVGLDEASVAAYVPRQRWAGAKGAVLADVRIEAVVSLDAVAAFAPARPAAVAVVAASLGPTPVRYQLPLAGRVASVGDEVIAHAREGTPHATIDGAQDAAYRAALLTACAAESSTGVANADGRVPRWSAARVRPGGALTGADAWLDDPAAVDAAAAAARVSSAEQSNTSIIYGDRAILKLFRRLERGAHPDVEIGAFLAARGFPHVPALLGTLTISDPEGASVAGMLQALVPGAEDAWAYATRAAADALAGRGALTEYAAEAGRLGAVTRALHDALASDPTHHDFSPEPARMDDVRRWAQGVHAAYDALVATASDLSERDGWALSGDLLDRARMLEPADALAANAADDAGAAIRHHGDYHLGQVLRTADGALFVVDFEGEPAKPLAARRRRHSPLRDVAGMLRSFAYAAGFAMRAGSDAVPDERAATWEQAARAAFLEAYFAPGAAAYLPHARAHADALVGLFEMEKLFYELRYELNNRPDWIDIPVRGLARLQGAG